MRSLIKLRWYRFGNRILHQVSGIPIGGPVSGAVLEAVLSLDEDSFDKFGWYRFSKKHGLSGPRHIWLSIVRYVDDVFIATHWFCPTCVEKLITTIYAASVNFDTANDGIGDVGSFNVIKFLDLWCYMSWEKSYFTLVHKNDMFSILGLASLKCKNRYPIPYGSRQVLTKRITCDFQGRIARFTQMTFSKDEIFLFTLMDFMELVRLGFSLSLVKTCWGKACSDLIILDIGLCSIHHVQVLVRSSKMPQHGGNGGYGGYNSGGNGRNTGGSSAGWNGYNGAGHSDSGNRGRHGGGIHGGYSGYGPRNNVMEALGRQVNRSFEAAEEQQMAATLRNIFMPNVAAGTAAASVGTGTPFARPLSLAPLFEQAAVSSPPGSITEREKEAIIAQHYLQRAGAAASVVAAQPQAGAPPAAP